MLELTSHAEGCVLKVRARPGARRDEVVGPHGGALKVAVRAAPEKGKANQAIAQLLAEALRVPDADVLLLSGATSPDKRFLIRGLKADDVQARLGR